MLSYVLAKAKAAKSRKKWRGVSPAKPHGRIYGGRIQQLSLRYFMNNTSILTNFGFVVLIGFIVGAAVTGQFSTISPRQPASFRCLQGHGRNKWMLLKMILLQAVLAGFVGFGLGAGSAQFSRCNQASSDLP